jgi:uncharacterized phage protein gp47/JayE
MSGTITTTPICTVDRLGIHAPSYQDVLSYLQQQYQAIYGADVYLGNDSQDGQFLAVLALAIHDTNSMAVAVYGAFSPATAQGAGLSSVVKINGIRRLIATNSTVDVVLVGQNGTTILNGIVRDANGNNWLLPPSVTIPPAGQVTATAQSANPGAVSLAARGIDTSNDAGTILTPTRGWQSASNPLPAVQGDPLESDAALRQRQTVSTALPSQTVLDGIVGDVASVPGVLRYQVYENDTGVTDINGIPPHSIAFVVDGGDASQIAQAIALKKTPGSPTYGTTTEIVIDDQGTGHSINFFRPTPVPITVAITIAPLAGFTTATEAVIVRAVADYISAQPIGIDVLLTKLYSPANLTPPVGNTFNIVSLAISRSGTPTAQDVPIAFNEAAICTTDNVTLTALVNP